MSTCHATSDAALASSGKAREFLSLKEVTVLADVSEARVRKDIETGLLPKPRIVCIGDTRLCFVWPQVFTFAAVYSNANLNAKLRKIAIMKLSEFVSEENFMHFIPSLCHTTEWRTIETGLTYKKSVNVDRFLTIDLEQVCHSIGPRVGIYSEGLRRIEEKEEILGGNAVFKGTRLPVRHIGKMALNGEPTKAIIEDYPYLNEDDIRFAKLYYKAHPPLGRPRLAGDNNERKAST